MLQLQRASAGSGKTYMLAKKFIEYFISVRDDDGSRRLRRPQELRDALCHILAITFTNKATNEMKLRIVSKLDALGGWTPDMPVKNVDYLADFAGQFHCNPQDIASICRHALKTLLSDYGDFKVSTIDSFFQTVLRTFAYEADLDDTYQIELDSNYVTQMGLDTTLDAIESNEVAGQGLSWVNDMMERKASAGKGWNIFQKQYSKHSVYGQVLNASANLAKEDFKVIREELDSYFDEYPDFYATYHDLCRVYESDIRKKHAAMRNAAVAVRDAFISYGLDMGATAGQYLASRVANMADTWQWDFHDEKKLSFKLPKFTRKGTQTRVFDPRVDNPHIGGPAEDHIEALVKKMYAHFDEWRTEALSERMKRWRIYNDTMPYVGLLQSVRANARLFLTENNTVELGETNSILRRIIGDDDAPFIYERMGNRLEHFLIDEFQDTSRLQWSNLRPLLAESEGKGNDNLIIGDAKQSIYRFRNADPGLITRKVPEEFAETCRECGYTPAENTNWRSSRRIVEFNNLFFRYFTRMLSPEMEQLYANTVQPPHHTEETGYVRVALFPSKSSYDEIPEHFAEIPELIADMLKRGYSMRDIAVLVDTRSQGEQVIETIMEYNRRDGADLKIDFISADSLSVGESPAVQTVVAILEAINSGTNAKLRPKEEWKTKGVGDWSRLKADFSFFARQNSDKPLSELLQRFLNGEYNPDAIREMLAEMSTTVLPALVENTLRHFISERMRRSEAPFIAAFQDSVLEFCGGQTADLTSFLAWWNAKGRYRSIASPEDADAVQIMTVHKSKGLEFRCVIVPYSKQTIAPMSANEREWLWVTPDLHEAEGIPPIPWIPVWSEPVLADTLHAEIYADYLSKYLTDKVNMAYVAYTRAIDELYIYSPVNLKKDGSPDFTKGRIGEYLWHLGEDAAAILSNIIEAYPEDASYLPGEEEFIVDKESLIWTFGKCPSREEVSRTTALRKKDDGKVCGIPISEYKCSRTVPRILYSDPASPATDVLPLEIDRIDEEVESEEMRIYGELMHSLMERINTSADIHRSLLRARTRGLISGKAEIERYEKEIVSAIESVKDYGWFNPGQKVMCERAIVSGGRMLRPDRVMLRNDGTAVIVDYKFGTHRNDTVYRRQLARYAATLVRAGVATRCESFIWYVTLDVVVRV